MTHPFAKVKKSYFGLSWMSFGISPVGNELASLRGKLELASLSLAFYFIFIFEIPELFAVGI